MSQTRKLPESNIMQIFVALHLPKAKFPNAIKNELEKLLPSEDRFIYLFDDEQFIDTLNDQRFCGSNEVIEYRKIEEQAIFFNTLQKSGSNQQSGALLLASGRQLAALAYIYFVNKKKNHDANFVIHLIEANLGFTGADEFVLNDSIMPSLTEVLLNFKLIKDSQTLAQSYFTQGRQNPIVSYFTTGNGNGKLSDLIKVNLFERVENFRKDFISQIRLLHIQRSLTPQIKPSTSAPKRMYRENSEPVHSSAFTDQYYDSERNLLSATTTPTSQFSSSTSSRTSRYSICSPIDSVCNTPSLTYRAGTTPTITENKGDEEKLSMHDIFPTSSNRIRHTSSSTDSISPRSFAPQPRVFPLDNSAIEANQARIFNAVTQHQHSSTLSIQIPTMSLVNRTPSPRVRELTMSPLEINAELLNTTRFISAERAESTRLFLNSPPSAHLCNSKSLSGSPSTPNIVKPKPYIWSSPQPKIIKDKVERKPLFVKIENNEITIETTVQATGQVVINATKSAFNRPK